MDAAQEEEQSSDGSRQTTHSKMTEKLDELGIELAHHPPYSPETAPSDYHDHSCLSPQEVHKSRGSQKWSQLLLAVQIPEFFARGIPYLPERCQYVADHNGE